MSFLDQRRQQGFPERPDPSVLAQVGEILYGRGRRGDAATGGVARSPEAVSAPSSTPDSPASPTLHPRGGDGGPTNDSTSSSEQETAA